MMRQMSSRATPNPHETQARLRKASRILGVLDAASPGRQITAYALGKLDDADWARAAVMIGKAPPSAKTRAVVAQLVRDREAFTADVAEAVR